MMEEEEEEFTLNDFVSHHKKNEKKGGLKKKMKPNQNEYQFNVSEMNVSLLNELVCSQPNEQKEINQNISLEQFLKDAFSKCMNKKERKEMWKHITTQMRNLKQLGELSVHIWEKESIPLLQREITENDLFGEGKAIKLQPKQTEQHAKIVDMMVKKVKEQLIKNTLDISEIDESHDQFTQQTTIKEKQGQIESAKMQVEEEVSDKKKELTEHIDDEEFERARIREPVVGTNMHLEKEYLRLTRYPRASEVRSLATLQKSFKLICSKYDMKEEDYRYFQSQMRSLRQDLHVQNIRDAFTMKVFEHNARVCLENYDIQEYRRCLGQLVWLYREGNRFQSSNFKEFMYYRLIQCIFEDKKDELLACLQEINQDDLLISDEFEKAIRFSHAISIGNVRGFFYYFTSTTDHGKYIMDMSIKKWYLWGLKIVCKTYGPNSISLHEFQTIFTIVSLEMTVKILKQFNCVFDALEEKVLIKETMFQLSLLSH